MKTRAIASAAGIAATGLLAAACHGSGGTAASAASAAATSTAVAAARADARTYFAKCIPASAAGQIGLVASLGTSGGRQALLECAGVPKADRSAAEACALANAEHAGKLPKGTSAKLDALLNDAYPCAEKYHASAPAPVAGKS
jgi:hypothetical protein